jgi:hypothetical protein
MKTISLGLRYLDIGYVRNTFQYKDKWTYASVFGGISTIIMSGLVLTFFIVQFTYMFSPSYNTLV